MKVELSKIKASPKPIRSAWDEGKMDELKWSLMEEGQVEPIGVHKNGDGYVLVWGHRRTEAARRAGWKEIEAVIVEQDEVNNLIQAGIENLAGEDMTADDKANWVKRLLDFGLSLAEISRRSSVHINTIDMWNRYRKEKAIGIHIDVGSDPRDEGVQKIVTIAKVLGDNTIAKQVIARKVSDDNLNRDQTRAVAEAYKEAMNHTPEVRSAILHAPIQSRDTAADILRRSIHRVEMETGVIELREMNDFQKERQERREMEAWDFAVKEFLDTTRMYAELSRKVTALAHYGKFTPEAARFTITKIDNLIGLLKTAREELEQVK